jgi:DNA-binding response OmpR family regulator
MQIALLEDDPDQAELLELWLMEAGHKTVCFGNGHEAIRGLLHASFDLLILDWIVPGLDGLEVLDWVREHIDWPMPVLFITRRDKESDVVTALERGADDYMPKPIKRREMLARIQVIMRRGRAPQHTGSVIEYPPYTLNGTRRQVECNGTKIVLTEKEFDLALLLFRNSGRALSRSYILENVWGKKPNIITRTVDTHISRLRRKLDIKPENGWQLISIYQHGYRLEQI